MELTVEQVQQTIIRNLMRNAFSYAEKAHSILLNNLDSQHCEVVAATLINNASSLVSSARAIYYSNIRELEKKEVSEIFVAYDEFVKEFFSKFYTEGSHQWTDINFEYYKGLSTSFYGQS